MEDSPLNLAHYHGRRAENHLKHRRYAKAMEHYRKASGFTKEAMLIATSPFAMTSLDLQAIDHRRQLSLINVKISSLEKYFRDIERHRDSDPKRKRSPSSAASLQTVVVSVPSEATISEKLHESAAIAELSGSFLDSELQDDELPHLAPLELPPPLDFESFRYKKTDSSDR